MWSKNIQTKYTQGILIENHLVFTLYQVAPIESIPYRLVPYCLTKVEQNDLVTISVDKIRSFEKIYLNL